MTNKKRDFEGNLTPLARALEALENEGCDCGVDEPGTCLVCLFKAALIDLDQDREVSILEEAEHFLRVLQKERQ